MSAARRLAAVPVALLVSVAVALVIGRASHRQKNSSAKNVMPQNVEAGAVESTLAIRPTLGASSTPPIRMQHGDRKRCAREAAHGPSALNVAWKTDLASGPIETQPIPSPDESVIYVATLGLGAAGDAKSNAGALVALDRKDGAVKFRVALGARSYATPCVDAKGNVYSASDAKKLWAVHPDGAIAWTLDLDDEGDTACALADDGSIVFAAGRSVYDVSANGDVAWRFAARGKVFTAPAIDDRGRVMVGSQDHRVYAIEHGHLAWSVDLGADVDGSPAIDDDGSIVVGTDAGDVVRLDENGGVVFSVRVGGFVRGPIAIARGGDVLVGVYGPRSRVVRLDAKTGHEKSSFEVAGTGAVEFGVHGAPLEDADGKLYFGTQDDKMYALSPTQIAPLFALQTGGDVDAPVTLLTDGALVVASDDGNVYYLRP